MITKETALSLAHLHVELEGSKKLLVECEEEIEKHKNDPWNRRDLSDKPKTVGKWMRLEVPTSESSFRCLMVSPIVGLAVLRAHVADVEKRLVEANEAVRLEIEFPVGTP